MKRFEEHIKGGEVDALSHDFEYSPEAEKLSSRFKDFFMQAVPFASKEKINALSPAAALSLFEEYLNNPSRKEGEAPIQQNDLRSYFCSLVRAVGKSVISQCVKKGFSDTTLKENETLRGLYQEYLLYKLPGEGELSRMWENDLASGTRSLQDLENAVLYRANNIPLVLGYHVAPFEIHGAIQPVMSSDVFTDSETGEKKMDNSAKVFFSTHREHLYGDKGGGVVHLVEGSMFLDKEGRSRMYDSQRAAHYSNAPLPVLFSLPLSTENAYLFGLKTEKFH